MDKIIAAILLINPYAFFIVRFIQLVAVLLYFPSAANVVYWHNADASRFQVFIEALGSGTGVVAPFMICFSIFKEVSIRRHQGQMDDHYSCWWDYASFLFVVIGAVVTVLLGFLFSIERPASPGISDT